MSREVSVDVPDCRAGAPSKGIASYGATIAGAPGRRGVENDEDIARGTTTRVIQSPMDALRIGMVSPLRNFLGLLKPPPLPGVGGASLHGSSDQDGPRASTDSAESLELGALSVSSGPSGAEKNLYETRREGQNVVMVAFDANVKEASHAGVVWAMENVLTRGDILTIVSVLDCVRGALGYRVKIGDSKWVSANQKLIEEEIQQKMEAWQSYPGLHRRCREVGVTLVVMVKAAQRSELAIAREAMKLGAGHVVLDKSLKNRHRGFYFQNFACNVTRMRQSGGVDVIRPSSDTTITPRNAHYPEPHSPTSVIPPPLLSYGDQIDEFEILLRAVKPKRLTLKSSLVAAAPPSELQAFRRLPSSAILATAHERSSSISQSTTTSTHNRASSASTPSLRDSSTSSSNATDNNVDNDDDLFSIFHGSTRHADLDTGLNNFSSGYESDDLFSIGNASLRRPSPPRENPLGHSTSSIPDRANELEPLRQGTIFRVTVVVGLGDSVTLTLQSPLRPGEGLLVGSSLSALFLMHAADRHQPHRSATISTATPNSYIAMEGEMAMKLSFLEPGQAVLAVDSVGGQCRTIRVENAGTHKKPLVLVEAQCEGRRHGVLLHHSDPAGLLRHSQSQSQGWGGDGGRVGAVKGLQVGDRVLLRLRSAEPSHVIWSS